MRVLAAGFILVGLLTASIPVSATVTDLHPADVQTCSLVNVPTCELANLQSETSEPEPPNPEIADLRQAAYYYNRYHDLAPDDLLLGLKHLTETCTALENAGVEDENCREAADRLLRNTQYALRDSDSNAASPTALSPAAVLRDALAARTDDRRIVAELLNVPVEEVELGPNLVQNGEFDSLVGNTPENWRWQKFGEDAADCGLFIGGTDRSLQSNESTLRITGIWEIVGKSCRAGYWGGKREDGQIRGQGEVIPWLERASTLRPGDLYVNYHLWRQGLENDDPANAAVYSETLIYFPLEAVHPGDDRLLDYVADVIPALLDDGLWSREKTLNVVSFLVWQHNRATGAERLLKQLMERYPADPDWPFYLAELYHRRGDLERAEAAYRQVLAMDPNYAQAYLRMGMIYEERAGREMEE